MDVESYPEQGLALELQASAAAWVVWRDSGSTEVWHLKKIESEVSREEC